MESYKVIFFYVNFFVCKRENFQLMKFLRYSKQLQQINLSLSELVTTLHSRRNKTTYERNCFFFYICKGWFICKCIDFLQLENVLLRSSQALIVTKQIDIAFVYLFIICYNISMIKLASISVKVNYKWLGDSHTHTYRLEKVVARGHEWYK